LRRLTLKIAVIGSRNFKDAHIRVRMCLTKVRKLYGRKIIIVTGGSGAVDNAAITESILLGLQLWIIPARWEELGKNAGPIRNRHVVKKSDLIYAFWNGTSKGTANVIDLAREAGKELVIRREK
jgi:hypothetical protein